MISTVTFDFWETLVWDSAENLSAQRDLRVRALHRALSRSGAGLTLAQTAEAHDRSAELLSERYWSRHRDPSHEEQVRLVLDCALPGAAARMPQALFAETVEAYISPVLTHPPRLEPGAVEAITALAARGVTLGIISNTGRTPGVILRRLLEGHGLLRYFSAVSYSDEVGYRKPDREIFHLTLARAKARPAEAVHVGDNALDDVTGAQGVGMRAVHYTAGRRPAAAHADLAVSSLAELPAGLFRIAS